MLNNAILHPTLKHQCRHQNIVQDLPAFRRHLQRFVGLTEIIDSQSDGTFRQVGRPALQPVSSVWYSRAGCVTYRENIVIRTVPENRPGTLPYFPSPCILHGLQFVSLQRIMPQVDELVFGVASTTFPFPQGSMSVSRCRRGEGVYHRRS